MPVLEVEGIKLHRPTRQEVESLQVGDLALDVFGKLSRVTKIYARREDISGRLFVLFYTETGTGHGTMSGEMTEGEPTCTLPAGSKWKTTRDYPC